MFSTWPEGVDPWWSHPGLIKGPVAEGRASHGWRLLPAKESCAAREPPHLLGEFNSSFCIWLLACLCILRLVSQECVRSNFASSWADHQLWQGRRERNPFKTNSGFMFAGLKMALLQTVHARTHTHTGRAEKHPRLLMHLTCGDLVSFNHSTSFSSPLRRWMPKANKMLKSCNGFVNEIIKSILLRWLKGQLVIRICL